MNLPTPTTKRTAWDHSTKISKNTQAPQKRILRPFFPMDSTRYFEFHEVWKSVEGFAYTRHLDVSSPPLKGQDASQAVDEGQVRALHGRFAAIIYKKGSYKRFAKIQTSKDCKKISANIHNILGTNVGSICTNFRFLFLKL